MVSAQVLHTVSLVCIVSPLPPQQDRVLPPQINEQQQHICCLKSLCVSPQEVVLTLELKF